MTGPRHPEHDPFIDPSMRAHVRIYHDPWKIGEAFFCAQDGEPWPCQIYTELTARDTEVEYLEQEFSKDNLYGKPDREEKAKKKGKK